MAYDFYAYQEKSKVQSLLWFKDYEENERILSYRQQEIKRFEKYIELCTAYDNNRKNTDRRYQQMLDNKMQAHENEDVKRSICIRL